MMRPGVPGGDGLGDDPRPVCRTEFGITLNPGHLIGLDEWMSSPIMPGSDIPLASGMAMQMDVIPSHADWGSTRMEDGYVIADAEPAGCASAPLSERRGALRVAGAVHARGDRDGGARNALLPLADTCGIIAPWLLDPAQVVVL